MKLVPRAAPPLLLLLAAALALSAPLARAQAAPGAAAPADTLGWKRSLVTGMTFSQSAFSNWTAGGTSSAAWAWSLKGKFEERRRRFTWRHSGQLEYGLLKQEGEDLRKSVDLIELETLYTRKLDFFVDPYASASVKTQFTTGRDFGATPDTTAGGELTFPATSDWLDPVYLSQSVGVGRTLIPEELATRLGFTVREVFTDLYRGYAIDDDEAGAGFNFEKCTGNPACDRTKVETGIESITEYGKKLTTDAALSSKLGLFYSFDQPDELDVSWRSDLAIKVLKVLSVNAGLELLFDEDVLDRLQTKQVLGIGVSYNLL